MKVEQYIVVVLLQAVVQEVVHVVSHVVVVEHITDVSQDVRNV